jgi:hypothetical protein
MDLDSRIVVHAYQREYRQIAAARAGWRGEPRVGDTCWMSPAGATPVRPQPGRPTIGSKGAGQL